ncbi:MAG: flagellin lysine-N-methylase [Oscillospiraceae bacterium]|nr:flagellin lysine-N-methylase [Oscillospiraceae bacterium]
MKIIKPSYFDTFRCIAGQCPDSCCKEWDVLVDEEKATLYRTLPGTLGERLRQVLKSEDGETYMTIENRRCPMWRDDGLCRIQAELGEEALCKTCRDFPRLSHDYGDFIEYGLELSCPEAARIILETPALTFVTQEASGGEAPEYDAADMEILLRTRETARMILADTSHGVGETLALLLIYGYHAQAELNGAEISSAFDADALLEHAGKYARRGNIKEILNFFKELEILTPEWAARLDTPSPAPWEPRHLTLARYFVDRYWLQAVSDFDLMGRVKLAVISCLTVQILGGNLIETAQLYSKEIENSIENVEAILDAAYETPFFSDVCLWGQLLL